MPIDYKKYHPSWKQISKDKIAAAGDRCELCYAPNHEWIYRDKNSGHPWGLAEDLTENGDSLASTKIVRVVLTVHHIDCDKDNNSPLNLIALCQRCHLRLDAERHVKNRRAARNV